MLRPLHAQPLEICCIPLYDKLGDNNIRQFCTCLDVKSRAFQYKFVNNILKNNYWLHKWIIKDLCTFCHSNIESLIHLFWFCNKVYNFFTEVEIWCNNQDIRLEKKIICVIWPTKY